MREKQQKTPYETYLSSNEAACLTKMFTSFKSHFWVCVVNEIVRMPLSDFPGQVCSEQSFVLKTNLAVFMYSAQSQFKNSTTE